MHEYKLDFDKSIGVKETPNNHEIELFERAQKYIRRVSWVPGLEMIAVVNSLSMLATHKESDIDLFVISRPGTIWLVRLLITGVFWLSGVWRHGKDIEKNFCLSFFITTNAIELEKISIQNDIYLYYWIYYMRPIFVRGDIYERFLASNKWVQLDDQQKSNNIGYITKNVSTSHERTWIYEYINGIVSHILLPITLNRYRKLGKPKGIIITNDILKFHNEDRREEVRDKIFKKNFDK